MGTLKNVLIGCAAVVVVPTSAYFLFSLATAPKNYDDCVMQGIRGTSGDAAVVAVSRACRNKFPQYVSEEEAFAEPKKR
jgi:hypothetical protein